MANLQHRMFLMTATVLLTAALLRGLIASIAPVAGQVGWGLDAGPGLVGLLTSIPVLCFAACMPAAIALVRVAGSAFALTVSVAGAVFGCILRSAGGLPSALAAPWYSECPSLSPTWWSRSSSRGSTRKPAGT